MMEHRRVGKLIITRLAFTKRNISATSSSSTVLDFHDIPTPTKGILPFGTFFTMLAKGGAGKLHEYIEHRHKQLGPIFRDKIGPVTTIFLSDPKDMRSVFSSEGKYPIHLLPEAWTLYNETYKVRRGIFFMDGEEWLQNRKVLNKLLLKGNFDWMESACDEVSEDLVNRWTVNFGKGEIVSDLETQIYRWSIDVILSVILGAEKYKSVKNEVKDLVDELAKNIYLIFQTSTKFQLFSARLAFKLNLPSWKNFVYVMDESLKITNQLVHNLIDKYHQSDGLLSKLQDEGMPKNDVVRILVDFIIAAGDTTAYTMEWLLFSVGTNNNVQERFRSLSNIQEANSYARSIVKESLRMYPVAPFLTRILTQEVTIGGFNIPPGTLLIMSIYTSGRDPRVFQNPDRFVPERWSRDGSNNLVIMQQSTLPFGFGNRSCIGKKVAELQLRKTIEKVIRSFHLEVTNKDEIGMILKMVAVPSRPLKLKLTRLGRCV